MVNNNHNSKGYVKRKAEKKRKLGFLLCPKRQQNNKMTVKFIPVWKEILISNCFRYVQQYALKELGNIIQTIKIVIIHI